MADSTSAADNALPSPQSAVAFLHLLEQLKVGSQLHHSQ